MDARKIRIGEAEALRIALQGNKLISMKGKRVSEVDPKALSKTELSALLMGPSGNLRAPTARIGKTVVVGFNPEVFATLF